MVPVRVVLPMHAVSRTSAVRRGWRPGGVCRRTYRPGSTLGFCMHSSWKTLFTNRLGAVNPLYAITASGIPDRPCRRWLSRRNRWRSGCSGGSLQGVRGDPRWASFRPVRAAPFHRPQIEPLGSQSGGPVTGVCFPRLSFCGVLPPYGGSARRVGFSCRHRPGAAEEFLPQTRSGCQQPAEASTTASRAGGQSHARGCLHPPCDGRQGRC